MPTATLPEGWRTVRLGDVCDKPRYGANAPARPFHPDLPRYVRITDISEEGQLQADDVRSADPEKVEGHELHPGDLLFARSGSVGRTYLYRPEDGPCVYAGYLIRFRPDPAVALPRYVDLYTHSPSYHRWVESVLHVGAQPNINAAEYSSLPLLLPPIPEQRAIAAVLDSIDEAIERTEEVIAATERLRDALLHELLTRGLPGRHTAWRDVPGLGTIPADWEVVRLGDVAEVRFSSVDKKTVDGEIPVRLCNYTDVFYNRRILPDMPFMAATATPAERAKWALRRDDVLFTKDSETADEIGIPAHIAEDMPDVLCGYHLGLARPSVDSTGGAFLTRALQSQAVARELARVANGITRFGLTLDATRSLPLLLPPLSEQQAIVATLDSVDAAIERSSAERAALQSSKASAADALLTGRVRVDPGRKSATACR